MQLQEFVSSPPCRFCLRRPVQLPAGAGSEGMSGVGIEMVSEIDAGFAESGVECVYLIRRDERILGSDMYQQRGIEGSDPVEYRVWPGNDARTVEDDRRRQTRDGRGSGEGRAATETESDQGDSVRFDTLPS